VLFLDEAPEFPARVLDVLRQPLEAGKISIHRANGVAAFPARFQLVLAANPCPCGRYGSPDDECTCTPIARRRYLARLSGPLLDRVDIRLNVRRLSVAAIRASRADATPMSGHELESPPGSSAAIRRRVVEARGVAAERLGATPWRRNAHVSGSWLRTGPRRLPHTVTSSLDRAFERGAITMRGFDRTLRLAWTLADLDTATTPTAHHVGAALFLRRGMES
jgi:magnesium chelatase family protein